MRRRACISTCLWAVYPPSTPPAQNQPINSVTELDWAVRADGEMVAVVTPAFVYTGQSGTVPPSEQYGCVAVSLDLLSTTNPFPSLIATATDADDSGQPWEQQGPSGCTYEPASNTGIVVVRHLINSSIYNPQQYQTYSLIDTGILP